LRGDGGGIRLGWKEDQVRGCGSCSSRLVPCRFRGGIAIVDAGIIVQSAPGKTLDSSASLIDDFRTLNSPCLRHGFSLAVWCQICLQVLGERQALLRPGLFQEAIAIGRFDAKPDFAALAQDPDGNFGAYRAALPDLAVEIGKAGDFPVANICNDVPSS
jgi:hypothetical protein